MSIDRVRFEPGLKCIEIKVGPTGQDGADFALVGAPILDEGKVLPIAEIAAFCYDPRHVWQIVFERWQQERWPSAVVRDRPVHARLMESFLKNLTNPSQHRGQLLAEIADGAKLKLARYFRLSVGINSKTGGLSIVLGHATVSEAAALQRSLGADRAILLGHGGNAAIGYHATRLQREGGPNRCVTCFASSTYSRSTHAALVIPLRESCQLIENVFVG